MREGWEIKKLGEVAAILNGYAFKSEKYVNEGVRIIRITNVQKGYITDDDPKFYPAQEEIIDKYRLYPNDLLISLTGNVGRVGLMPAEMLPAALNQRVACIRPITQKLLLRYLFYHLNNSIFEEACIKWSKGLAQKNMSTEWLKEYPLIIPPLSEQKRIVAELDLLSEVIAKKREQLTQLDALAQSLFYTMFGDPITNEKGWKVKTLDSFCILKAGKGIKSSDLHDYAEKDLYPCYGGNGIRGYIDKFSHQGIFPIIGRQGALCGNVVLAHGKFYATEHAVVVSPIDKNKTNPIWLWYTLFLMNLNRYAQGVAQPGLAVNILNKINIISLSLFLQQQFAEKIEAIEQQKERIRQSLAEVQLLFDSRMDYYFNN